jgi:dihydroorotase
MEEYNIVFCLHGEVADQSVDVFDREARFLDDWWHIRHSFQKLRMVFEHITTEEAVKGVQMYAGTPLEYLTAATATPQHILANRNFMLGNGLDPHAYCKPIAKREEHRVAVLEAVTSGSPQFFLGTDSAPHDRNTKEAACGCAGCFTGLHALELYAEAFASVGKIHMLPDFAGYFGAQFYGLPAPTRRVSLALRDWTVPMAIDYNGMQYHQETGAFGTIVPFYAGKTLQWKMLS